MEREEEGDEVVETDPRKVGGGGECEIGRRRRTVRAAETEKFPAGVKERKAGREVVGKIGKRETRVKTTQNAIDRDGESRRYDGARERRRENV